MSSQVIDEDEEVEVRELLNRHRKTIESDLESKCVVSVLLAKGVVGGITEGLLSVQKNPGTKCDLLIDTIAKGGFRKFQEFCYAVEEVCPTLINEMMLSSGEKTSNGEPFLALLVPHPSLVRS